MTAEAPVVMTAAGSDLATAGTKPARPSPGHLVMCGHALTFGAISATISSLTEGKKWGEAFRTESCKAADAITPVGGFVLSQHVFKKD
mmetsp:Transcript_48098/g.75117  ORF Transcript_48098/g.75117 Transcript_48098/m.75117 type:complete len:88 (+) Transcript_48098:167-430(+)